MFCRNLVSNLVALVSKSCLKHCRACLRRILVAGASFPAGSPRLILCAHAERFSGRGSQLFSTENLLSRCLKLVDRRFKEEEILGGRLSLQSEALLPPLNKQFISSTYGSHRWRQGGANHLFYSPPLSTPSKECIFRHPC